MSAESISIERQVAEVELHVLGLTDQLDRALSGKLARSPADIQRLRERRDVANAAAFTLRRVGEVQTARLKAGAA